MTKRIPVAVEDRGKWNRNIDTHSPLLAALSGGREAALDVGCGEGVLTRQLRDAGFAAVTGIDLDGPSIDKARSYDDGNAYILGDALTEPLPLESFDAVVSVATLHHLDMESALVRFAALTRPGGVVAVSGFAMSHWPRDLPLDGLCFVWSRIQNLWRKEWQHSAPIVWPPPLKQHECRAIAERTLPGAVFKRRPYMRYTLVWRKPVS